MCIHCSLWSQTFFDAVPKLWNSLFLFCKGSISKMMPWSRPTSFETQKLQWYPSTPFPIFTGCQMEPLIFSQSHPSYIYIYTHYFLFFLSLHILSSLTMFQCGFYWINELSILTVDIECSSHCGRLTHPVVSTTRVVTAIFTLDIVLFMVQRTGACGQLHTAVLADNGHGGCGPTTTPTAGKGHCVSLADSGVSWPRGQLQGDPCGRVWKNITAYMYR